MYHIDRKIHIYIKFNTHLNKTICCRRKQPHMHSDDVSHMTTWMWKWFMNPVKEAETRIFYQLGTFNVEFTLCEINVNCGDS